MEAHPQIPTSVKVSHVNKREQRRIGRHWPVHLMFLKCEDCLTTVVEQGIRMYEEEAQMFECVGPFDCCKVFVRKTTGVLSGHRGTDREGLGITLS